MAIIITIFKSQFSENPKLVLDLAAYAGEISKLEEAFIDVPKAGQSCASRRRYNCRQNFSTHWRTWQKAVIRLDS